MLHLSPGTVALITLFVQHYCLELVNCEIEILIPYSLEISRYNSIYYVDQCLQSHSCVQARATLLAGCVALGGFLTTFLSL